MKKFIHKITLFSLPVLIILFVLEILLRQIPNDYLIKRTYLDKHSSEIETLILGSSHSFYGINPDYFSSRAFNAGYTSQTLNFDFEIIKKYSSKFDRLKTVVVPISYFTLYSRLEDGAEPWRVKNYNIYYKIRASKSLANYTEVFSNRLDVNLKRLKSYYVLNIPNVTSSELGWFNKFSTQKKRDIIETGKKAALRHSRDDINSSESTELINDNVLTLNLLIDWCENRNIKVLLLTLPAFETYRQNLKDDQLSSTINSAQNICKKHENCKYLNFLNDARFIEHDFFDADHLSEAGAEKLSTLLNELIKGSKG
jgi:hypothetical protein